MTSTPLPSPAEVAPGVWSIALPFPNPLRFAFAYVADTPAGPVVVDAGWDSEECWTAFQQGLVAAGTSIEDVAGVVITHVHPDHYGLAERVRKHSSAWIAMHPAETPRIATCERDRTEFVDDLARWLRQAGAPGTELDTLAVDADDMRSRISMVQPDHLLTDGDAVPSTGGALRAVHTPGHTPGHLCFRDEERDLLFTGDHILPRVTPNISKRPGSDEDPLGDFLTSAEAIRPFAGARVLPGHEWSFDDLAGRLDDLAGHHDERMSTIERAVNDGAGTVWEVASTVPWARPFDTLEGRARRGALGETQSHLHRLAVLGRIRLIAGTPDRWHPSTSDGQG